MTEVLQKIALIYLAAINIYGFIICGADKLKAKRKKRRVPEKTLFIISAIGGSLGMFLGMLVFRHKTRHLKFVIGISLIILLQAIAFLLLKKFGII